MWVLFFRFPIGAHVVGAFIMPCGNCFFCSKVTYEIYCYIIWNAKYCTLNNSNSYDDYERHWDVMFSSLGWK